MIELANNSLFQAAVISPVIGLILGILFGGGTKNSSRTYREIREIVIEKPAKHNAAPPPGNKGDDSGGLFLAAAMIALVVAMWLFARYWDEVTLSLLAATMFLAALASGFQVVAMVRGRPLDTGSVDTLLSLGLSAYSVWAVWQTREAMNHPLLVQAKVLDPWNFFQSLSLSDQQTLLFQMVGLIAVAALMLFISVRSIHHLSLYCSDPNQTGGFWWKLAWFTRRSSGVWGLVAIVFLGTLAWLCAIDILDANGVMRSYVLHQPSFR